MHDDTVGLAAATAFMTRIACPFSGDILNKPLNRRLAS